MTLQSTETPAELPLHDFITRKEEGGLKFYRECLKKTNQFSAKFILAKVIEEHQTHVRTLKTYFNDNKAGTIRPDIYSQIEKRHRYQDMIDLFDLTCLTHLEAIKLGLKMTARDIEFYQTLSKSAADKHVADALEAVISIKNEHLKSLQVQYDRLNYSNGM